MLSRLHNPCWILMMPTLPYLFPDDATSPAREKTQNTCCFICALVDREFRVVDEWVPSGHNTLTQRVFYSYNLCQWGDLKTNVCNFTGAYTVRVLLTFRPFFSQTPSVPMPESDTPSQSLSLSCRFTAAGAMRVASGRLSVRGHLHSIVVKAAGRRKRHGDHEGEGRLWKLFVRVHVLLLLYQ